MTPTDHPLPNPNGILTNQRPGAALGALVGVSHGPLDEWRRLPDDDRTPGQPLFVQPTRSPGCRRATGRGMAR